MVLVTKLLQVMNTSYGGVRPATAFVESGFGGPIVDRCRQLGHTNVIEVGFGAACPDSRHYANMRAWMWSKLRDFLMHGSIDRDPRLATDLAGPAVKVDRQDRICLESKEEMEKRGLDSPDDGDALHSPSHDRSCPRQRKSTTTRTNSRSPIVTSQVGGSDESALSSLLCSGADPSAMASPWRY